MIKKKKLKTNIIPLPIAIIVAAIIIAATLFATQEKDPMYLQCLKSWGYYDTHSKDSKSLYKERCR